MEQYGRLVREQKKLASNIWVVESMNIVLENMNFEKSEYNHLRFSNVVFQNPIVLQFRMGTFVDFENCTFVNSPTIIGGKIKFENVTILDGSLNVDCNSFTCENIKLQLDKFDIYASQCIFSNTVFNCSLFKAHISQSFCLEDSTVIAERIDLHSIQGLLTDSRIFASGNIQMEDIVSFETFVETNHQIIFNNQTYSKSFQLQK